MKSRLFLLLLVPLWLWPALVVADEAEWRQHLRAGIAAYQRGEYEEAIRQTKAALKEAEDFGGQDPRYAISLNNLALLYQAQGRYAEAEPFGKCRCCDLKGHFCPLRRSSGTARGEDADT